MSEIWQFSCWIVRKTIFGRFRKRVLIFMKNCFSKNVLFLWASKESILVIFKIHFFYFHYALVVSIKEVWSQDNNTVDTIQTCNNMQVLVKFDNLQADKVYFWLLIKMSFKKSIYKKIAVKKLKKRMLLMMNLYLKYFFKMTGIIVNIF